MKSCLFIVVSESQTRTIVECAVCRQRVSVPAPVDDVSRIFAECLPEEQRQPPAPAPPDLSRDAADAPGFLAKVRNFATAAVSHVAAGMPTCTDEEIIARHNICLTCEHLKDNACSLCGCPVARAFGYVSKLSWADQECPAGKWGKIERKAPENPH